MSKDTRVGVDIKGNYKRADTLKGKVVVNTSFQSQVTKSAITRRTDGEIIIRVSSAEAIGTKGPRKTG